MSSRSRAKAREAKYAGPIVDGVQYAPGYTPEAAEYEERTKMIRINIDDKPRPSWQSDPAIAQMWDRLCEKAVSAGWSIAGGWHNQPTPHGEVRVSRGAHAITTSGPTPASAALDMEDLLDLMETKR